MILPRFTVGTRGRHLALLTLAALLVAVPAAADVIDWTRGAGTADWGNATNWTSGVPTAADTAQFTDTGPGTVDLGGARSVDILSFINASGNNFTLTNGTLSFNSFTQTGTGVNVINATLSGTGTPTTGTISAGSLRFNSIGNTFTAADTITVNSGGTLVTLAAPGSTIGDAGVNLNGGTMRIDGQVSALPGLMETVYNVNNIDNPTSGSIVAGPTRYSGPRAGVVSGSSLPWTYIGDNETIVYIGQFYDADGVFAFAEQVDDATLIKIDGAQVLRDTSWNTATATGRLAVTPGWHDIEIRFANGGGGAGPSGQGTGWTTTKGFGLNANPPDPFTSTNGNDYMDSVLDPGDASLFRVVTQLPGAVTTSFYTTANSTLALGTDLASLTTTGQLRMAAGTRLDISATMTGATMSFGSVRLDGNAEISTANQAVVTLNTITEAAPANLTLSGNGTAILPTSNSYTGLTTINGGVVRVSANGALGTTAAGTVVNSPGSLRLAGGVNYSNAEALTLNGTGNALSTGALNNNGGSASFAGPITLGSAALIQSDNNTLTLAGGINKNGFNLTFGGAGNTTISGTGISGAADVIKNDAGTLTLDVASTYDGPTVINNGRLVVRNSNALGSTAAGTVVNGGGELRLENNITIPAAETVTINGDGYNTEGALRNESGDNTVQTLVLGSAARVTSNSGTLSLPNGINLSSALTVDGGGTVSIPGLMTGGSNITKVGGGTLVLANGGNSFTGPLSITAGTVRATADGALGTIAGGTTVSSGGTLEFSGAFNYTALEPISIGGGGAGGAGALNSTNGNRTLPMDISLTDSATIGSGTAGSKLTLSGQLTMPFSAALGFTGAGDIDVVQAFGNGNAPMTVDALDARLHLVTGLGITSDAGIANALARVADRTAVLTGAMNFPQDSDTAFTTFFGGGQPGGNAFTALFRGTFTATTSGTHAFAITQNDDTSVLWIDRDQNGTFSTGGAQGNELIQAVGCCNNTNGTTVDLNAGIYNVVWAVEDTGGGSGIVGRFQDPPPPFPGGTSLPIVNPTAQAGRWLLSLDPNNNVTKDGTGTTTLFGANTYNGTTMVNAGTLVAANDLALGLTDSGTVVKNGGTLGLQGGVTIAGEAITLNGLGASGRPGALANLSSDNRVTSGITAEDVSAGQIGIGSDSGTLTLDGPIDLRFSKAVFNGAGNVVVNGAISGVGVDQFVAGIDERIFNRVVSDAQNNIEAYRSATVQTDDGRGILTSHLHYNDDAAFSTRAAALGAVGFDNGDFSALWVARFTPTEAGAWGVRFNNVDDNVSIWVDYDGDGTFSTAGAAGNERVYYRGCCAGSGDQYTASLAAGQPYLFGIAMSDTGGGGYLRDVEVKAPSGGWVDLNPSALGTLFTTGFLARNELVKNGTGTVTLAGNNTYNSTTTANQGTLVVAHNNALGATTAGTTVADDATLAFQGNVTVGTEPLTVGRFTAPGKEGLANLSGTNSFAGNVTTSAGAGDSVGIRSDAGQLTLSGTVALGYANLTVDGSGDTVISNTITGGGVLAYANYPNAILNTPDLRAYYRLGEAAGATTAIDLGPNGYNGTYQNGAGNNLGATSVYPPLNTALHLDGADDYVSLTNASNLGIQNSSFTALAWINADTLGGDKSVFGTAQTGTNVGLHLIVRDSSGNRAWMGFYSNDTAGSQILSPGTWYLMTWRYDISNGEQAIFINGALDNAATGHAAFQGNDTILIGRWGGGNYFDGIIDEAAFFNRALTDAEILNLYNQGPLTTNQTVYSNLVKRGLGTLTLGGNNTYNGTTTVEAGTLLVNGTTSGQGSYLIQGGATLGGTGTIGLAPGASVTFQGGSFLSPGTSPGTLTILGDLVLEDGATYLWELGPTAYDSVALTGTLTLNNWLLRLIDDGGAARESDKFYLFTGVTIDDVIGMVTPTIDWSLVPLWAQNTDPDNIVFDIDDIGLYMTGLASTPEPATLALLALGGLALLRRRRRTR